MKQKFCMRAICMLMLTVVVAANGCVYMNVQGPLDRNFDRTELGSKRGEASSYSVLWLVAWGDAGSKAAADDGGITVINHADTKFLLILGGLFTRTTTVAYGD
ncbi:MAG: hypothetical protein J7M12_04495 [Candidatus Hydrogenedentes bacterium]|nr:hypothetical protein [Candidatus Hydrogenedentota bacterium]